MVEMKLRREYMSGDTDVTDLAEAALNTWMLTTTRKISSDFIDFKSNSYIGMQLQTYQ